MGMKNEAAAEARRAYMQKWRRDNPDKVRAHNERYWARKGEERLRNLAQERKQG